MCKINGYSYAFFVTAKAACGVFKHEKKSAKTPKNTSSITFLLDQPPLLHS